MRCNWPSIWPASIKYIKESVEFWIANQSDKNIPIRLSKSDYDKLATFLHAGSAGQIEHKGYTITRSGGK